MHMLKRTTAALTLAALSSPAMAEPWTPVWMAAPQEVWADTTVFDTGLPDSIAGITLRQPLTVGFPAQQLRLVLSNRHGTRALPVEAASLGLTPGGSSVEASRPVLFGGRSSVLIAAGAKVVSDPVDLSVASGTRLAATFTYGAQAVAQDFHWDARETSYVIDADSGEPRVISEVPARLTLSAVLSDQSAKAVVVAMGDSITDGNGAPMDGMARWPDYLATSLADKGGAVVNAGISGGRLLSDGMGRSVLARLDHDALALPRADVLVLLIGTNDIAWPGSPFSPDEPPMTLSRLRDGLQQVAARTRAQGMKLVVGTIPPFKGALPDTPMEATYWSAQKDALRREFNDWLRQAARHDGIADFDGLVDFDQLLSAPGDDMRLNPAHDSGDHLHPGTEGNRVMAEAVAKLIQKGLGQ